MSKSGTNQACARCRYQRRKCTSECVLAPFFPPDKPKIFQNAHKLFGVGNILKLLKDLDETQKREAMKSIIYEADIRDRFPVHGCLGVIMQYQYQIQQMEEQLQLVLSQLVMCKQREARNNSSQLLPGLSMTSLPQNALDIFETQSIHHVTLPTISDPLYYYSGNVSRNHVHQIGSDNNVVNNSLRIQTNDNQMAQNQLQALNIQQDVVDQDYEFIDAIDDGQSSVDSRGACELSLESCVKDSRYLTSVN
ncbi:LOB domain-containing protein [Heracleum sosnowskyi]|uniref:LOB domain-containing protein n=1 Tax=Heracleum sosnowskyi TaxID=360622 RepID=A0AAD8H525_9APIA|nr:LOB domain-containing protein [Heracleum sosnowskyi]